jgi:hypothetical protein
LGQLFPDLGTAPIWLSSIVLAYLLLVLLEGLFKEKASTECMFGELLWPEFP